ncbi:MAG: (2Fe-2S)-binding protein [Deltaproteobacteria bacterium]|nr:(2Fe-2S)-binding protein [Deltaproteobacteria bacterium]
MEDVISEEYRVVCFCHNVMLLDLLRAIQAGADTLEKIKADTCASTGCGGCKWDVVAIIEQELKDKKYG